MTVFPKSLTLTSTKNDYFENKFSANFEMFIPLTDEVALFLRTDYAVVPIGSEAMLRSAGDRAEVFVRAARNGI